MQEMVSSPVGRSEPAVAVVGSCVMDLVVRVERRPRAGETVFGKDFGFFLGGKGFNQAVAARRAGAAVSLVGLLGRDPFGEQFLQAMEREGIGHDGVALDEQTGTGVAVPIIDESGQNSIVVVPRANAALSEEHVARHADVIRSARIVMLQLEVAVAASLAAARLARAASVPVLWNPAPAAAPPAELFELTDILVANEVEAAGLTDIEVHDVPSAGQAARSLRKQGVQAAIVTLGALGLVAAFDGEVVELPAHRVTAVDTTGAGDAFCGALAAALVRGGAFAESLAFANAAGALAVTRLGAEPSLPARKDVLALLSRA